MNLDKGGKSVREVVDDTMLKATQAEIRKAGEAIRQNRLERLGGWCVTCTACDLAGICREREVDPPMSGSRIAKRG